MAALPHWVRPRTFLRPESELLSLPEVATHLRVSRWQVYQLINAGDLCAVQIGRRRLVARVDLEAYVEQLRRQRNGAAA